MHPGYRSIVDYPLEPVPHDQFISLAQFGNHSRDIHKVIAAIRVAENNEFTSSGGNPLVSMCFCAEKSIESVAIEDLPGLPYEPSKIFADGATVFE